jgi:phosphohistidine phosphatase
MRRLMLLRHAKSDWSMGEPDHDRDLSARGRGAAPRIGAYLADRALIPDCVLVSTARRTRETWALVESSLLSRRKAHFDKRIYEAEPDDILEAIREMPAACQCLLVIGHNPGLQDLALMLAKDGNQADLDRLTEKFPTAGLAIIDMPVDDWSSLRSGAGRLDCFITPRGLDERTDPRH